VRSFKRILILVVPLALTASAFGHENDPSPQLPYSLTIARRDGFCRSELARTQTALTKGRVGLNIVGNPTSDPRMDAATFSASAGFARPFIYAVSPHSSTYGVTLKGKGSFGLGINSFTKHSIGSFAGDLRALTPVGSGDTVVATLLVKAAGGSSLTAVLVLMQVIGEDGKLEPLSTNSGMPHMVPLSVYGNGDGIKVRNHPASPYVYYTDGSSDFAILSATSEEIKTLKIGSLARPGKERVSIQDFLPMMGNRGFISYRVDESKDLGVMNRSYLASFEVKNAEAGEIEVNWEGAILVSKVEKDVLIGNQKKPEQPRHISVNPFSGDIYVLYSNEYRVIRLDPSIERLLTIMEDSPLPGGLPGQIRSINFYADIIDHSKNGTMVDTKALLVVERPDGKLSQAVWADAGHDPVFFESNENDSVKESEEVEEAEE